MRIIERSSINALLDVLKEKNYTVVGPTIQDKAIVYDEVCSDEDLPIGWTDKQSPGSYQLKKRGDNALFGFVVGPTSWKKFLYPPKTKLWSTKANEKSLNITDEEQEIPQYAFLGVRPCELSAIGIQDRVFLEGSYVDPIYKARRNKAIIIAVNCGQAASTCFCASMNTGPQAKSGFDLSLTEIIEKNRHYLLVEIGTEKGGAILEDIPSREASSGEVARSQNIFKNTVKQMARKLDTNGIKELLYENAEHSHWEKVAQRCLSCANCTMSCPTCFCSTVEDVTDLTGSHAERWRLWDSCFTMEHSYLHGGHIRSSTKSRYRQWLTHKLASWQDQFDEIGCVGCGRCITWCPVGIDITEEVKALKPIGIKLKSYFSLKSIIRRTK